MDNLRPQKIVAFWSLKGLSHQERIGAILFSLIMLVTAMVGLICVRNAFQLVDRPFAGFLFNERCAVGHIGQYHWSGIQAGLKDQDKLLKLNDRPIRSAREMKDIIKNAPVGNPIKYSVQRGEQIFDVAIPTMRFTLVDFFMTFGILFMIGVLYLIMGVIVFVLKPNTRVSWVFFLGCLLQGLSSFTSFDIESTHFGFVRAYLFDDVFFPAIVMHLALLFPEKSRLLERYHSLEIVPYLLSLMIVIPVELSYPGPLFVTFYKGALLYIAVGAVALIVSTLHAHYKSSSVLAKQRAKVIMFGAALALPIPAGAPLFDTLGGTVGGTKILTNFFSLPAVLFPASIAYAIAKHNLFDVDVYIKRTVGYGLMTAIVGLAYFLMQTTLDSFVMRPLFGEAVENIYPVFFAVLVVFFFTPVNRVVQGGVDKLFYRKKFDYKGTVIAVSDALTTVLDLTAVIRRIVTTVRREMFIDAAGIILTEPQKKSCQLLLIKEGSESINGGLRDAGIPCDDPLLELMSTEKKLITKYDLEENPQYFDFRESCNQRFLEMGATVMIPLLYQGEAKGALVVGQKKSGHFYTREDIDLLSTLASHGATAINNSMLIEQMKKEEMVRTNLSRYLSPQIVERVIHKDMKVNLGGDRKVVTVLFSDIRNFTTITESRPADQLVTILNEYFSEMAKIIFANQGSLDKYIGDAIVAVFGSLIPLENSARNAVDAAVQMMKQIPLLNERWQKEYQFSLHIGIGVNTGEVFLGNIGSPERMEFTVIGDVVNVASRFSGLAKPGQVLVTKETRDCLGTGVQCNELPPTAVKGKTGMIEVFEIAY